MAEQQDDGAVVLDLRDLYPDIRDVDGQPALVLSDGVSTVILSPGLRGASRATVLAAESCAGAALLLASELRLRIPGSRPWSDTAARPSGPPPESVGRTNEDNDGVR